MASNETVAEIKYRIYSHWRGCENCSLEEMNGADLIAIADQFEAAHNREMNHRALIAGVFLANAVDDEHKRELAAKNRKIELLEMALKISNGMNDAAAEMAVAKNAEIAELRECVEQAVWDRCAKCTIRTADYEDIVNGDAKCEYEGCECQKWRKALEGANDETLERK